MKRHLLTAAILAAVAIPAVPASAQSLGDMLTPVSAQSYDRYDRRDDRRGDRYDRDGYRGDRGYGRISRSEAARIASPYLHQITLIDMHRNGNIYVSGRQRDGSLKMVTLYGNGRIGSVVTTRDPRGRRINYDHGIGDTARNRW